MLFSKGILKRPSEPNTIPKTINAKSIGMPSLFDTFERRIQSINTADNTRSGNIIKHLLYGNNRIKMPKAGLEPARGSPTTPSRWRVYQFHHFGVRDILIYYKTIFVNNLYFLFNKNFFK